MCKPEQIKIPPASLIYALGIAIAVGVFVGPILLARQPTSSTEIASRTRDIQVGAVEAEEARPDQAVAVLDDPSGLGLFQLKLEGDDFEQVATLVMSEGCKFRGCQMLVGHDSCLVYVCTVERDARLYVVPLQGKQRFPHNGRWHWMGIIALVTPVPTSG